MCFPPLTTVKLLYLVWFGASSCLVPYLNLHMRALGVPAWESSLVCGILPLLQLLTCPLVWVISRSSPSYKKSTLWSLLFTSIAAVVFLLAPAIPTPAKKSISMHFQCGPDTKPGIILDKCGHDCEEDNSELIKKSLEAYFTECHVDCPDKKGVFKNTADLCFDDSHSRICHVVEVNNTLSENFTFGISLGNVENRNNRECLYQMDGVTWHQTYFHHISCPIILTETNTKCTLKCDLQEVANDRGLYSLTGMKYCLTEGQKAVNSAVWIYFSLRAVFHFSHGISLMMIDSGLLHTLRTERKSHQKYTIWSFVSSGIVTPLAGLSIDLRKHPDILSNFTWLFLAFSGLVVLTIVLVGSLEFESSSMPCMKDTVKLIIKIIKEPEISTLLLAIFLLGAISGFFDTFLFWYLEDLSTPYYIMGISISTGLLFGIPLLYKNISLFIEKLGRGNLLTLCMTFHCLRCIGYYFLRNFWWSLLLEFWGSAVFHLLWKTVSMNSKVLIPSENLAAFQAYAGALHYGIGKGCGSFAGGALMAVHGFQMVFMIFGSFSGILAFAYFILYHSLLKKLPKNMMHLEEKPTDVVAGIEDDCNSAFLVNTSFAVVQEQLPASDADASTVKFSEQLRKMNSCD